MKLIKYAASVQELVVNINSISKWLVVVQNINFQVIFPGN
jgi:hypothetical protein